MDASAEPHDTQAVLAPGRWRRRARAAGLLAASMMVGVAVGLTLPWMTAPRAEAQLRPTAVIKDELPFEAVAVDPTTLVQYEDSEMVRAWSAESTQGLECLFVVVAEEWWGYACAPGKLDPTVNFSVIEGVDGADAAHLPVGSLLRCVLRDGVVEVWIAETSGPEYSG
jgi:hypothetical protein